VQSYFIHINKKDYSMQSNSALRTLALAALLSLPLGASVYAQNGDENGTAAAGSGATTGQVQQADSTQSSTADATGTAAPDTSVQAGAPQSGDATTGVTPPAADTAGSNPPVSNDTLPDNQQQHGTSGLSSLDPRNSQFFEGLPGALHVLGDALWIQLQSVGALAVISFMGYKAFNHLKQIITDKESRGRHVARTLLYATSSVLAGKVLYDFVTEAAKDMQQQTA
jgi:hypothetical protein